VQVLLQSLSPRIGGVLLPFLALAAISAAPYLARKGNRPGRAIFWGTYAGIVALTVYFLIRG